MNTTTTTMTQPIPATAEKQPTREGTPEPIGDGACFCPLVDIAETNDKFLFLIDLPGVKAGGIDVTYDDGTLTIEGKVDPREPAGQQMVRQEYEVGDFRRAFDIGTDVNAEAIRAEFKNGELKLHVPKAQAVRVRKIPVKAEA